MTKSGWREIPRPPIGFGYLPVTLPNELLGRIQELDPSGHWERELSGVLSEATERFFLTRPVTAIATPSGTKEIVQFFDPRDPLKHPLDRRPI